MRLSTLVTAISALASVYAAPQIEERDTYQISGYLTWSYSSSSSWAAPSSTGGIPTAQTHSVVVGGEAGLVYTPEFVFAEVGDVVILSFGPKNHTFTQSSFAQPCLKLDGGTNSFPSHH